MRFPDRLTAFDVRTQRGQHLVPVEERFWQKVDKSGECWIWTGAKNVRAVSYGVVWIGGRNGRNYPAHKVSYEMANGPVPDGLFVLHKCDNGLCVNPGHLFLGTHEDNMADMVSKGRQARGASHGRHTKPHRTARGESNGNAKLTQQKADSIRGMYSSGGFSLSRLATDFGVSKKTILNIIHRRIWV